MQDVGIPWLTFLLSGFVLNKNCVVLLLRLLFYVLFIVVFIVPAVALPNIPEWVAAAGVAIIVFVILFLLYILNLVVDKSIEVDKGEEVVRTDQRPANIPRVLWDRRDYYVRHGINEDEVMFLIQRGYDPDVVFEFFHIIRNRNFTQAEETEIHVLRDKYLKCGDKVCCRLPFSRAQINALFPVSPGWSYIVLATILAGLMTFVVLEMVRDMGRARVWASMLSGAAIYSLLHPPETEPYSTTRGDVSTGLTRCYSLSVLGAVWRLSLILATDLETTTITYFGITFNWVKIHEVLDFVCKYGFYFFPFFLFGFIGHPVNMIWWSLEWFGRYLFGHSGSASIVHCIGQLLRSSVVAVLNGLTLFYWNNSWKSVVVVLLSYFLLQIPLVWRSELKYRLLRHFFAILGHTFLSGIAAVITKYTGISFYLVSIISAVFSCVFSLIWPYLTSYNIYPFVQLQIIPWNLKAVPVIQSLAITFCSAMIVSSLIMEEPNCPPWFVATVCVLTINRALMEPHIFATSMILLAVGMKAEMIGLQSSLALFIAMTLARKVWSILPMIDYWLRERCLGVFSDQLDADPEYAWLAYLMAVYYRIPFVDRCVSFVPFLWSLVTGAPMNSPNLNTFFQLPASPRANAFWEVNNGQAVDVGIAFRVRLTEHPLETPVYASLTKALCNSLGDLIGSGKLGIVDNNDIFLFVTDEMACFVHIISHDAHAVHFQLRGLEYRNETACHRMELSDVREAAEMNCFERRAMAIVTNWQLRRLDVSLDMYSVSSSDIGTAIVYITSQDSYAWSKYAFAYVVCHTSCNLNTLLEHVPDCNHCGTTCEALYLMGFECNDEILIEKLDSLWHTISDILYSNQSRLNLDQLISLFNERPLDTEDAWLWSNEEILSKIVYPTAREIVLVNAMASMQLLPDLEAQDEIRPCFDELHDEYMCQSMLSAEFYNAFVRKSHSLVSVANRDSTCKLLFFRTTSTNWTVYSLNREFVRSYWSSEAQSQLFYGVNDSERASIQHDSAKLHNLIIQSCNFPIGYCAFISPVCTSYHM